MTNDQCTQIKYLFNIWGQPNNHTSVILSGTQ